MIFILRSASDLDQRIVIVITISNTIFNNNQINFVINFNRNKKSAMRAFIRNIYTTERTGDKHYLSPTVNTEVYCDRLLPSVSNDGAADHCTIPSRDN